MKYTVNIHGMHCKSCAMLLKDALEEVGDTVESMKQEKKDVGVVIVDSTRSKEDIAKTIEAEGEYKVTVL